MLGGMLAGHDQGGGKVIKKHYATGEHKKIHDDGLGGEIPTMDKFVPVFEERHFVQFYGMSSDTANKKHFGGLKEYRSSEGRDVLVPYRGDVANTIQDILGGLRSTCTYVGAPTLKQLSKCATFVRATNQYNRVFAV
jgi:GMP reductase